MGCDIDFVITWVDSSDQKWSQDFSKYKHGGNASDVSLTDTSEVRYRDWGLLRYWFRAVEQYAPWVRYIHFVTYGHLPSWLDTNNPKLKIVRHEDYIPKEYLPIFNSNPIELMFHRIPELAEHFVYFNDDFYLTKPVSPDYFFHNGKPCEMAVAKNHHSMADMMLGITQHNMAIINSEFNVFSSILRHPTIWFRPCYRGFLKLTFKALLSHNICSLLDTHAPSPLLKSTYNEAWEKYGEQLAETMSHRFRSGDDYSYWLIRYWQIVKGDIEPRNIFDTTKVYYQVGSNIDEIVHTIKSQACSVVVLNDSDANDSLDKSIEKVNQAFSYLLPEKSSFEV